MKRTLVIILTVLSCIQTQSQDVNSLYLSQENTPLPTLGGQTIYDLTLTSVESKKTFEINGKFRHTISGCNNTYNP